MNQGPTITNNNGAAVSGTLTVSGTVDNGSNPVSVMGAGATTISGPITGSGGVIVTGIGVPANSTNGSGDGVLTLSGANTYTGTTTINGGDLKINNAGDLGNSTSVIFGGIGTGAGGNNGAYYSLRMSVLDSTGGTYSLPANQNITLNGEGTIQADGGGLTINGNINTNGNLLNFYCNGGSFVMNGIIGGSGAVQISGLSSSNFGFVFNAANTYSGPTIFDGEVNGSNAADEVKISAASNLGNGSVTNSIIFDTTIGIIVPWNRPMEPMTWESTARFSF